MAAQYCAYSLSVLLFIIFLIKINKGYARTFFNIKTRGLMTVRSFKTFRDDRLKASTVFTKNKNQWKSIRNEVKDWVQHNWEQ